MPVITVPAGVTSRPHFVSAGSVVKISPSAGASAIVEYTNTPPAGISNGVATWAPWPAGVVLAETSDVADNAVSVRITSVGGPVDLGIENSPSVDRMSAFRRDWRGIDRVTGRMRPVRVYIWGDSITNYGQLPSQGAAINALGAQTAFTTRSWYARAAAELGGRMNIVGFRGRSGQRLDQIANFFANDVLPSKPSMLILEGGSNDIDQGQAGGPYSSTTAWAAIMQIYQLCQANGITLVYVGTPAGSIPTQIRGVAPSTTEYPRLHAIALGAAQRLPGFMYYDMSVAVRDYTTVNATSTNMVYGMSIAAAFTDNTHPSAYGMKLMGHGLANFLDPYLPRQQFRTSYNTGGGSGNPMQLVSNNFQGTVAGTGVAGSVGTGGSVAASNFIPDRWDLRRSAGTGITGVLSNITRPDGGPGKGVSIAVANAASEADALDYSWNEQAYFSTFGVAGAIGTVCRGVVEIGQVVTSGVINNINLIVKAWSGVGANTGLLGTWEASKYFGNDASPGYTGAATDYLLDNATVSLLLRTPDFTMPAGADHVSMTLQIITSTGAVATITAMNPQIISDQWTALLPAGYY